MKPIITLTTDFGMRDGYVACMKGVIVSICADVMLVDITHDVPPQDIRFAARILADAVPYFPTGTIHLAVIDPGVGTARTPLALATPTALFVGPDNGVFAALWHQATTQWAAHERRAVALTNSRFWRVADEHAISATFHGRDIFAPVAAHLAAGVAIDALGTPNTTVSHIDTHLAEPVPIVTTNAITGSVIAIDHFGNCITNITRDILAPEATTKQMSVVCAALAPLPLYRTYADVSPGMPLALFGSTNRLEIALCNGHASNTLGIVIGAPIRIETAH